MLFLGAFMLVAPQANLGLKELKWLHKTSFPGEVLVGIVLVMLAMHLFKIELKSDKNK